jgi:TrmH family RNA methyltransferase
VGEPRHIVSKDNPLLVRLRKLAADPGAYRRLGELWIEGEHLCSAFVRRGGVAAQALIAETGWADGSLRSLAQQAGAVAIVPDALMRGVSALESPPALGFVVPWHAAAALKPGVASVVLDRLQDAGNVGSILRSAAAFGFVQVLALKGTAAFWSSKVLRAGMGAHFGLHLVEGLELDDLAALELPLLGSSSHAAAALHETLLPWPCAWVFGHEGGGIDAQLEQRCRLALRIPQPGGEESLNVASAAAVCLYESLRQRPV